MKPIKTKQTADMIKATVVLERPSSEELAHHSRAEKYNALRENTAKLRERIIEWIRKQELEEEISRVGEPTAFNVLFFICTPKAAEQLVNAPGVISVSTGNEFEMDLPRPKGKTPQGGYKKSVSITNLGKIGSRQMSRFKSKKHKS